MRNYLLRFTARITKELQTTPCPNYYSRLICFIVRRTSRPTKLLVDYFIDFIDFIVGVLQLFVVPPDLVVLHRFIIILPDFIIPQMFTELLLFMFTKVCCFVDLVSQFIIYYRFLFKANFSACFKLEFIIISPLQQPHLLTNY